MRLLNNMLWLCALTTMTFCAEKSQADEQALVNLNNKLEILDNFSSTTEQTVISSAGEVLQQLSGRVAVAKPGKFRIETSDPMPQTLVSDGETLWNYDPDLEQLIISPLSHDIGEVPILILSGNRDEVGKRFTVENYQDENGEHFVLIPQSETSLFSRITLSFQGEEPASITIVDSFQQSTEIKFVEALINQELEEGAFAFLAPAGTDVINDS